MGPGGSALPRFTFGCARRRGKGASRPCPRRAGSRLSRFSARPLLAAALSILLASPVGAAQPPRRVASLNLCTDDIVLLLADPDQIVSVSYLSHDPRESALWRSARRHAANDGSMLSIAALKPDLIVASGGGPRDRVTLARAIGARVIDLPYPLSLDDLMSGIRTIASALGRPARGDRLIARIEQARRTAPRRSRDAIFLSGGGRTLSATGMGAAWLRLAGIRQRALPGDRISVEGLLRNPPTLLLRSNYRAGEISREGAWLTHPALRAIPHARTITTDGRRWTCMGPSLLPEILRLRSLAG